MSKISKKYKKTIYSSQKREDLSQYRPLQKFIDRLVFNKLKFAIKNFCSNMTPELLQAISPRLYKLVYSRNTIIEIRFKLLGLRWPPRIIYSTNLSQTRVIGFNFREIENKPGWRMLFTDEPVSEINLKNKKINKSRIK